MRQRSDNKTRDLWGKPTAQEKHEARLRQAAHWVPVIRRLLQGSEKAQGAGGSA